MTKERILGLFLTIISINLFAQLSQPTLSSPGNGSTVSNISVSLQWSSLGSSGYNYDYQYDTLPTLNSSIVVKGNTTSNSVTIPTLYFGCTYYWRIKGHNSSDDSPWSAVWSFQTPAFPTPTAPTDGKILTTEYTTLKWNTITGCTHYDYVLDTCAALNSPVRIENSITTNSVSCKALRYGKTYYWKVRARHATDTSQWSPVQRFTTPASVTLSSPSNNYSSTSMSFTFSWSSISNSTYYQFECDTTTNFDSPLLYKNGTSSNSLTTTTLHYAKTYYWHVRACNENDTSAWSAIYTLFTPTRPNLSSPANYSALSSLCTTVSCTSIASSTGYIFECDTAPGFNTPALLKATETTYSHNFPSLYYGKTHFWRICAYTSSDTSDWSLTRQFTTPAAPTLSTPADNSALTQMKTTLYGKALSCSDGYIFETDTTSGFSSAAKLTYTKTSTSCAVSNLYYGKTYYWRMKAYNSLDTSAWSTAYRFTTPAAIYQTSPADGSAMTAVSITLQWNTLTGSTYYYVECDTSQSFNSPLHITDSINGSSKTILFHYGKTYYWRVKACNENDTTQWSLPWSFTTPAAVTLSSPADYYQNTTLSASLSWSSISGTSKYEAQWDTSASFNSPLLGSGTTTSTSKSASVLHYGKTYFWRVRAMNAVDTSAWSLVRHFMTPSSFNLSSPSDSSAIANVKATLSWKSISCDQYICQYDTNAYFSSPAIQTIATTTTSCTASDLYYGTRYHWRVAAVSSVDTSAWTAAWTFTTPASVTLKSPADNSTINANTQKLTWNTFTGNTYYDYQYDTTPNFNSTMLYTASCSSGTSAVTVSNLMFCTTYYWRVRARNNNDISQWSAPWQFTTSCGALPTSPTNGDTISNVNPSLQWQSISGVSNYQIECSTDSTFTSLDFSTTTSSTSYSISPLYYGTTYYWRIRSCGTNDTTAWTSAWSFTTPATVKLKNPADSTTISSLSQSIGWYTISGSTSYLYQYDTVPSFDSPYLVKGSRSSSYSTASATSFRYEKTIYWRIKACNSVDSSEWSATWRILTPGPVKLSSPTDSSTISGVTTTLSWNSLVSVSTYQYQYDTTPNFNSQYLVQGTRSSSYTTMTAASLKFGATYYWRVRGWRSGDTTSWSKPWCFSTGNNISLTSPADNSYLNKVSSSFSWSSIQGATSYQFAIDTTITFTSPYKNLKTSTSTSYTFSNLLYGEKHYWKVRAINGIDTSAWSATWSFTTRDTVTLTSPNDYTSLSQLSTTLQWGTISGSKNYIYQCDTTIQFNSPFLITGSTTSSSVSVSSLGYGKTYYWHVRALNDVDSSTWSASWHFTTPSSVTLTTPADSSSIAGCYTTLYWNTISGSTQYEYCIDTTPLFNSPLLIDTTRTNGHVLVDELKFNTTYYWRVIAINSTDTSVWSVIWSFTTASGVTLSSPADNTALSETSTTITWNALNGSSYYDYAIDTSAQFNSPALNISTTSNTSATINPMYYGVTYYWKVRARTLADTTQWSQYWSFTTPAAVTLKTPTDMTSICSTSRTISWYSISGSTGYIYQCDTSSNFNSPILFTGDVTSTSKQISPVLYGNRYYWRVCAYNSIDTSAWSAVWSFDNCASLSAPTLISPANLSTNIPLNGQLFQWSAVSDATDYELQYSTSNNFTTYTTISTTTQSAVINGLSLGTTYYWRVRARNSSGNSLWSSTWQFTTKFDHHFSYQTVDTCSSYNWHNHTYNLSGTYYDTTLIAPGIDSIEVLTLIIHPSYNKTLPVTACKSFYWNGTTYTQSGNYSKTFQTVDGCDSIITIVLTIENMEATTSYNSATNTLICHNDSVSYQWIDCNTNSPVNGATNSTLIPTQSGKYAVIITSANSCSDTSDCTEITLTSVKDLYTDDIICQPNPTSGTITITGIHQGDKIALYDMVGKCITTTIAMQESLIFNMDNLQDGIYFISVESYYNDSRHKTIKKIIKE
ncbi:MAG: fibronectin type III domain-containing protein [Bacteroidales bacterium]|nr:fibronectin type III domain-containing protein [Bacteroidales bacterium]